MALGVLIACSPSPSLFRLAPGLLALGWAGGGLATALDRDRIRQGALALTIAVGLLMVPDARHAFSSEREALDAAACPGAVARGSNWRDTSSPRRWPASARALGSRRLRHETRFEIHLARRQGLCGEAREPEQWAALIWRCRLAPHEQLRPASSLAQIFPISWRHMWSLWRGSAREEAEELARARFNCSRTRRSVGS